MKKFIFGFILGAMFFGSIGVAAVMEDTIKIKWDINEIYVDGKSVALKKNNPAFTYNGVAYVPSYVLSEMGYSPSRSADGKNILLNAKGREYIPSSSLQNTNDDDGLRKIIPSSVDNTRANVTFNVNASEPLVVSSKTYENYIHTKFQQKEKGTKANSSITFQLNEDYRRFSTKFALASVDAPKNEEPVTLIVYLTNDQNKVIIYKSYTFNGINKSLDLTVPLRGMKAIEFDITNTSAKEQDLVMLNPIFVK